MLKVFANSLVFSVLYGASVSQSQLQSALDCTFDHDQVLNENGVEVSVSVRKAVNTENDGFVNLNFNAGRFKDIPNIKAWCVDLDRRIKTNNYDVDVLSSLDANVTENIYTDAVDNPQYLPSINWMFNTHPTGSKITIPDCVDDHTITDQEFQLAVWRTVDDHTNPDKFWKKEEHQCVVIYLNEQAENHMDYEPDCANYDSLIGLIIIVDDDDGNILKQTLIAEIKLHASGVCDCTAPAVFGDPHFKTWAGEYYDFHGICDLMLIKNLEFENGLGMEVHVRSTKMRIWSYISTAAIRIGGDILEIVGGQGENKFWINGVPGDNTELSNAKSHEIVLTSTLSGYPINFKQLSEKQREFAIDLGKGEKIAFNTWNAFVGIHVKHANQEHFQNSVGLMGSFPQGLKLARDNASVIDDMDVFGQEWQVLASEPKLFHNIEGPQHPNNCEIPTNFEMRRRLGESNITIEDAKKVCVNVNDEIMDLCVFDVMATSDESIVGAY